MHIIAVVRLALFVYLNYPYRLFSAASAIRALFFFISSSCTLKLSCGDALRCIFCCERFSFLSCVHGNKNTKYCLLVIKETACDVQVHPKSKNFVLVSLTDNCTWEGGALPYERSWMLVAKFELRP